MLAGVFCAYSFSIGQDLSTLDRYLEWGLFDSLSLGTNAWISARDDQGNPQELGHVHLLRGIARLNRKDTSSAREDFHRAVCLDSSARPDSFFVPATMIRFYDEQHEDVMARRFLCAGKTAEAAAVSVPNVLSSPLPAPPQNRGKAMLGAAWTLAGIGLVSGGWALYQWSRQIEAYDKQAEAGRLGQSDRYGMYGREVHDRKTSRNLGLGVAALSAIGSGICFYWGRAHPSSTRTSAANPLPRAYLTWMDQETGLELAWVF